MNNGCARTFLFKLEKYYQADSSFLQVLSTEGMVGQFALPDPLLAFSCYQPISKQILCVSICRRFFVSSLSAV